MEELQENTKAALLLADVVKEKYGEILKQREPRVSFNYGPSAFRGSAFQHFAPSVFVSVQDRVHVPWESDWKPGDPIPANVRAEKFHQEIVKFSLFGLSIGCGVGIVCIIWKYFL